MAKTVEQIASDLNLSVTTVRLVLNGKAEQYRISVKTQTRINEYVERYGYIINHSARSLKLNKTDTLGLIVPNISRRAAQGAAAWAAPGSAGPAPAPRHRPSGRCAHR